MFSFRILSGGALDKNRYFPHTVIMVKIGISAQAPDTESTLASISLLQKLGAEPYLVCNHAEHQLDTDLAQVAGWIIMGNDWDIDPTYYIERYDAGHAKRAVHPKTNSELSHPAGVARAKYETELVRRVVEAKTPLMGICGGMQRINVVLGGTLDQHMPDWVGDDRHCQRTRGIDPRIPEIPILIEGGTLLAQIASELAMPFATSVNANEPKVIYENSIHHQCIDRLADGLRRCGVTDVVCQETMQTRYIMKAFETAPDGPYAHQFIMGMQWHPEFCASELGPHAVRRLIAEANK